MPTEKPQQAECLCVGERKALFVSVGPSALLVYSLHMYKSRFVAPRRLCSLYSRNTWDESRTEMREDKLAAGDAFSIAQCAVGLRADLRSKAAPILKFAKEKYRTNGKACTSGSVYLRGFWVTPALQ